MKGKLYVSASGSETFHAVQQMVSKISRKLYIYIYIYIYVGAGKWSSTMQLT